MSNINANNIDGTYPVAGVDNDSQGFRTNFTNIKNNLTYAKTEIEDLQSKVILKSSLTGSTLNNDMSSATLYGAEVYNIKETVFDLGTQSGSQLVDHSVAHVYTVTTNDSIDISFTNFPAPGKLGRIKLKIVLQSIAHTFTLPLAVNRGLDGLEGYSAATRAITFSGTGTYWFEFLTTDQGSTVHITDLSRPRVATATNADWSSSAYNNFDRYVFANVGNNFAVSVTNTLYLDNAAISNLTGNVYLPDSPGDGQKVVIQSNNAISTLRIISNNNVKIYGNSTTTLNSANSNIKFQYVGSASPVRWIKY